MSKTAHRQKTVTKNSGCTANKNRDHLWVVIRVRGNAVRMKCHQCKSLTPWTPKPIYDTKFQKREAKRVRRATSEKQLVPQPPGVYTTMQDRARNERITKDVNAIKESMSNARQNAHKALNVLSMTDLRERGKAKGIKGYSKMKKADLVEALL